MVLASDSKTAATSVTVTGLRILDGAVAAAGTGTISEVGLGVYSIEFTAADTNADTATFIFSASTCDDTEFTILTRS